MFPLFATGDNDTGGKFAAVVNDTSGFGGKFATGVVDTGEDSQKKPEAKNLVTLSL